MPAIGDLPMFKFTIRDLLWLTVVAALWMAWWVDHNSLAWQIEEEPMAPFLKQLLTERGVRVHRLKDRKAIVHDEYGKSRSYRY